MTQWSTRRESENQPAPEEANEDELCLSGKSMARFSNFVELKKEGTSINKYIISASSGEIFSLNFLNLLIEYDVT